MNRVFSIQFLDKKCYGLKSISEICARCNKPDIREKLTGVLAVGDSSVNGGSAVISNVMPRVQEHFFIEKPARISEGLLNLNLSDHKFHRFMKYLPLEEIKGFFQGRFDFQKNSEVFFGSYRKTEAGDQFVLAEEVSLYFFAEMSSENTDWESSYSEIEAILLGVGFSAVKVISEPAGEVWKKRIVKKSDVPVLALTDIETQGRTLEELRCLIQDAQYTMMYSKKKNSIVIKCGAYFPKISQVPESVVCIKVDE